MQQPRAMVATCLILLAGAGLAPASAAAAAAGTPVERVVDLLTDLKEKLSKDEEVERQLYDKYACWCEKTSNRKAEAIEEGQHDLRAHGQQILKLKGKTATLLAEIQQLEADVKANLEEQAEATAIREKENAAFMAETAEEKQAIAALQQAIVVLVNGSTPEAEEKKKETFIQEAARATAAVRNVIEALPSRAPLKPAQVSFLNEFLASSGAEKYMPQSLTVQGMLKDMYETFAKNVERATLDEATANRNFENFIFEKQQQLKEMRETKARKEDEKADAEEQLATTQQIYDDTQAQLEADVEFFDATKDACEEKHEDWTTRSELRAEEIEGVAKALEILTSDDARELFASAIKEGKEVGADSSYDSGSDVNIDPSMDRKTSFLQLSSASDSAASAYGMIRDAATKTHSLRLAALAVRVQEAKAGHFDKVITEINEMINILKEEGAADIEKRDQCKSEYQKIASEVAELEWKIEKNIAKIDKLTKLIEQRQKERADTIQNIKDLVAQMLAMTEERTRENEEFLNAKKEDQDAIALLMSARGALTSYYDNQNITMGPIQGSVQGVFVQQPEFEVSEDQAPDAVFSHKGKRKNEAKGIVQILTSIIEDLQDEIRNGMKAEEGAQRAYEDQMAAAMALKQELEDKVTSLENAIARRTEEKDEEETLLAKNKAALKDDTEYKASITPDCDWIIGAFTKRASARQAEMEGLTGAKDFLVGASPSEASLLQGQPQPRRLRAGARSFDDQALSRLGFLGLGA